MQYSQEEIEILIAKVVSREATPAENSMLQQLAETDANIQIAWLQTQKLWDEMPQPSMDVDSTVNVDLAWQGVSTKIKVRTQKLGPFTVYRSFIHNPYLAIAASLLLLLGVSVFVFTSQKNTPSYTYLNSATKIEKQLLQDGSLVTLRSNSSLFFDSKDFNNQRAITLTKGEAFFEVVRAKGKRFSVITDKSKIIVLGTKFTVAITDAQTTNVSVIEGRVRVVRILNGISIDSVEITPGQSAIVSSTQLTEAITMPDATYWATQELQFNQAKLKDVCKSLSAVYKCNITLYDDSLSNNRITAVYRGQKLEDILAALEAVYNVKIEKREDTFYLKTSK